MAAACAGFALLLTGQSRVAAAPLAATVRNQNNNSLPATAQLSITATTLITQSNLTVSKTGNGAGRIASTPNGIDCGADCTEVYDQGTQVTLTASADPGSTFTGWQGACSGAGAVCTLMVNATTNVTALFTLNQYQVTAAKAGNGLGQITSIPAGIDCGSDCTEFYAYGALVTINASADSSSTFAGWIGACSGNQPVCTITVDAAKSVTAIFILNQYSLTLNKSGGGAGKVVSTPSGIDCGNACTASYPHGTALTLTATAATGSTFAGWQDACSGAMNICTITMDAAKAATALFTLNQYTVTIQKAGNGSGVVVSNPTALECGNTCAAVYGYGANVNLTATPAVSTRFVGWSGACTGTDLVCTVSVDAAKSVTATFALKQYPVVVQKRGTGTGMVSNQPGSIICGSTCSELDDHGTVTIFTATADASSLFTGWQGACTNTTVTCTLTIDSAKLVTATFTLKQYGLTVQQQGTGAGVIALAPGGGSCNNTCSSQLNHGTVVTLTATAALSSTFAGWQGACTGSTPLCTLTMDNTKAVTATFTLKQFPLAVTKAGNGLGTVTSIPTGIACGVTCTQSLTYGTPVTLTATAADHSTFAGWQGACTGNQPTCTLTANATKQVTATFTLNRYALTVSPQGNGHGRITTSPSGVDCGITCTTALDYGTAITLTATPFTDTFFTNWQGGCTGTAPTCVLTLTADTAVTATFTLRQYALTVAQEGTGAGIVISTPPGVDCGITCTVQLNHGTPVSLTATAAVSSTFTGWQGACAGLTPVCTLTLDRAQQVTATFALNSYDLTVLKTGKGTGVVTGRPTALDCGLTCTVSAAHGTLITLTATPDPLARFIGWEGACGGTAPNCTVNLTAPQTVTATFGYQQYPLTVTKSGSGAGSITSVPATIDCGITCTALLDHGTVVTLTTTPGARSAFAGWDGACTELGPCVVTMTAATVLTATFTGVPVASLAAAIAITPTIAATGQPLTYTYWITNTGDLSVTVAALSTRISNPRFLQQPEQTVLTAESYLRPGATAIAIQPSVAPRCNADLPLEETFTVTGTTASGITTTAQVSLTVPLTQSVLPPQTAKANTIYSGCTIQMAFGRSNAPLATYDMIVIVGAAPSGLLIQGAQSTQPYRDAFTLQEQTNALLNEGCPTTTRCRTIRRLVIEQGKAIQVETITDVVTVHQLFMPLVRK